MGTIQILAAIFATTGIVFLMLAKGGNRLLRILGIIMLVQGIGIFVLGLLRG
ncbi:MAG: hypothetical protein AB1578_01145 [Thermodesulfobacteriota bacterium]|jgi:hypothetical protein